MLTRKEIVAGLVLGVTLGGSAFWLTRDAGAPSPTFRPAPQIDRAVSPAESTPVEVAPPEPQVTDPPEVLETATQPTPEATPQETPPEPRPREPKPAEPPRDETPAQRVSTPKKSQAREKGILGIYTQPWSNVWIDGAPHGATPLELELTVGRHEVVLQHGGQEVTQMVTITAGNTEKLTYYWQKEDIR